MNKQENRSADGRCLKGQTGNAAGRGMTNRQRISEKLFADPADVWAEHSTSVLQRLAVPWRSKSPGPSLLIQAGNTRRPLQQQRLTMPRGPDDEA